MRPDPTQKNNPKKIVSNRREHTGRNRNHESLRENETSFRLLFANHPYPMWVYDLESLQFLEVNDAAVARYGYSREEFFQMRITDIRPPEETPPLLENLAEDRPALQTSGPWQHRLKSGEVIRVEISSHTLEFGGRGAVLVMAQDITERLRAEERFQLAVEAAPNAMVMVDQQGKIILVNRQTEQLFGYARDELIGQRVEMLVPPQARGVHANYRTGFFASPQARPMGIGRDLHGLRRDGSQFPVEIGLTPVETEEGTLVLSAIVDITTHKQAEAKLAESLARERVARAEAEAAQQNLAFLVEASSILSESFDYPQRLELMAHIAVPTIADWCAIDILEEDGGLRRVAVVHLEPEKVELAYELHRRYPPDPDSSTGVYAVLRSGKSEMIPEITGAMLETSGLDDERLAIMRELGLKSAVIVPLLGRERPIGVITLVMAESGRHYGPEDLALAEDLARRAASLIENARLYQEAQLLNVELEQRVVERTAQLEATNSELEAFSYSVSHDLRAPLRHAVGYVELLQRHTGSTLDEKSLRYLNIISDAAARMGALIDDLLAFSRIGRTELQEMDVDMESLVEGAIHELRPEAVQREVKWDVGRLSTVSGDKSMLRLVWINLISNALKYTRPCPLTEISIGCTSTELEEVFFIRDNGVGFDMKYVDKLFGVFQRLHRADEFEGTGIGLATVQRVIHRHGGRAWAEGAPEAGAAFFFSIPKEQ